MGQPVFFLQIADERGAVVHLPAGGALERDLVQTFTDAVVQQGVQQFLGGRELQQRFLREATEAICAKGVGFWRTESHVRADIEAGLSETLTRFLMLIDADVRPLMRQGITQAVAQVKRQARSAV